MFDLSRRTLLQGAGQAALGAVLAANLPGTQGARAAEADFDIDKTFENFMAELDGTPADAGGAVVFTGRDPIVRSHFRIGACMAVPAMAAALGAAAIWRDRTGEGQDLSVDLRESVYNVMPIMKIVQRMGQAAGLIAADDPVANSFTFMPTVNGLMIQVPLLDGNPLSFAMFETKDGRYVSPTGLYPHHLNGFLNVIGSPPNTESIAKKIKQWNAFDLDDAVAEAGMVMGVHRTREEWDQHPQGKYLAGVPLVEIVKVADSNPVPYDPDPTQPLSGIKTLALTHVIAGTCAARTLAEYGAQVLHVARDQSVEHEGLVMDVNVGMRSTFMNLRNPDHKQALTALLPEADVFIEGFRGRSMEKLGFSVDEVATKNPGKIYLSVRCYGWEGPWWDRGGFDMEALTVTGFTIAEGAGKTPRFPPTMVLNDYIAGYLGAAGVIAALRRRAKEGGSYHVRISLAKAALWFASLGSFDDVQFDATDADHRMIDPRTIKGQTPYGELHRLAPQVVLSKTPGRWRDPLVSVRGGARPVWEG